MGRRKPARCTCGHPFTEHSIPDVGGVRLCLHVYGHENPARLCGCLDYVRQRGAV